MSSLKYKVNTEFYFVAYLRKNYHTKQIIT